MFSEHRITRRYGAAAFIADASFRFDGTRAGSLVSGKKENYECAEMTREQNPYVRYRYIQASYNDIRSPIHVRVVICFPRSYKELSPPPLPFCKYLALCIYIYI